MGDMRNAYKILVGRYEGKRHSDDLDNVFYGIESELIDKNDIHRSCIDFSGVARYALMLFSHVRRTGTQLKSVKQ
jgi:hypothetical protein